MAYGLRLTGIAKNERKELFRIEPTWWTIPKLREFIKLKWITANDTGSYSDLDTDIALDEVRKIHEYFKPEILKRITYNVHCLESSKEDTDEHAAHRVAEYTKYISQLKGELDTIESALGVNAEKFANFHLCIFEWDSGY